MLLNNFVNNNQPKRPSENINLDDIYQQVISEQPDEENLFQDGNSSKNVDLRHPRKNKTKLTFKKSIKIIEQNQQKVFSSLTQSEKALEIQKIYEQSLINSLMFQIHEIIENQKQKINQIMQIRPQRKNQLQIYNQKLQSMTDMLKQTMGTTNEIKIFISKKILIILKNIGRFQQVEQYNLLINKLNKIGGIKQSQNDSIQQNQNNVLQQQHKQQNQNFTLNKIKNYIRRKKKAMTLNLRLENKSPIEGNQQPVTFWHRVNQPLNSDDQQFKQILHRVDSIHEKHLQTWFKHKTQMKQLQQKKNQIKLRYSSLHTKKSKGNIHTASQGQYKRVNKFFSLLQDRQKTLYEEEKQFKECFQGIQNQVFKRLNSLPTLNQNVRTNSLKKQHQVKLKIDLDVDCKRKGEKTTLKLTRLQKRHSPIKSNKKNPKSKKSSKNEAKNSKDQDEILQIKKNKKSLSKKKSFLRSSTEVSIQKSQNKNNSVQKSSNFRNFSPLPVNKNNQSKEKQVQRSKLAPLKILNKQKQHKLKIV